MKGHKSFCADLAQYIERNGRGASPLDDLSTARLLGEFIEEAVKAHVKHFNPETCEECRLLKALG